MANPTPSWEVVSQRPTTGQDAHGHYVAGQEVRIKTGMGHEGTVFVAYSDYAPERLRPILASLALRLDAVGSLKSPS